ncbi:hypothetical protein WA026_008350, partial [Henosepilachna vigintioctopunctata]
VSSNTDRACNYPNKPKRNICGTVKFTQAELDLPSAMSCVDRGCPNDHENSSPSHHQKHNNYVLHKEEHNPKYRRI